MRCPGCGGPQVRMEREYTILVVKCLECGQVWKRRPRDRRAGVWQRQLATGGTQQEGRESCR